MRQASPPSPYSASFWHIQDPCFSFFTALLKVLGVIYKALIIIHLHLPVSGNLACNLQTIELY